MTVTVGSLFTGIGTLDLAVCAVLDAEVVWHVESDPAASKVLAARFPGIPNLGDVTAVDWATVEPVDVLTAGFPCQDISHAGLRAGITEGTRSGLWRYVAYAVRDLRPRLVCMENVAAILVRGMDVVAADLAEIGYDVRWTCLRASDVGAPHRRDRWFGIAYPAGHVASHPEGQRGTVLETVDGGEPAVVGAVAGAGVGVGAGDPAEGVPQHRGGPGPQPRAAADPGDDGRERGLQPDGRTGRPGQRPSRRGDVDRRGAVAADAESEGPQGWRVAQPAPGPGDGGGDAAADPDVEAGRGTRSAGETVREPEPLLRPGRRDLVDWGRFEPAIRQWEAITGYPVPPPTGVGTRSLNPDFVEWMMAVPPQWTAGISRSARLRCLGNAVVPPQAVMAFQRLVMSLPPDIGMPVEEAM